MKRQWGDLTLFAAAGLVATLVASSTLAADPRVLRRPVPVIRETAVGLEVEFALLPDLAPGEIAHVQAQVRAAGRGV